MTPGVNVTLRCRAPQPTWRFALFKSGEIASVLYRDVSAELAEFFLEEVTPDQGGNYRCCYQRLDWGPGVWSHPSDALELLVTGESLGEGAVEKGHRWDEGGGGGSERERKHTRETGDSQPGAIVPPSTPTPSLATSGDIFACHDWGRVCYCHPMGSHPTVYRTVQPPNTPRPKNYPDLSKNVTSGNSLAVQWLGLRAFTAKGAGSIPGRGTKIQKKKSHQC